MQYDTFYKQRVETQFLSERILNFILSSTILSTKKHGKSELKLLFLKLIKTSIFSYSLF